MPVLSARRFDPAALAWNVLCAVLDIRDEGEMHHSPSTIEIPIFKRKPRRPNFRLACFGTCSRIFFLACVS
jgi:hypothetical protein